MALSLRSRIVLTAVPLLVLLGVLGGTAAFLLYHLGNSIHAILRENYDSVVAMERLNEALERIDSSFQFALAGEEEKAKQQYQRNWPEYDQGLLQEEHNITLPGEDELVAQLTALTRRYLHQGDAFYRLPAGALAQRRQDYFGENFAALGSSTAALGSSPLGSDAFAALADLLSAQTRSEQPALFQNQGNKVPTPVLFEGGGLLDTFNQIKDVSGRIRRLNEENMKESSRAAIRTRGLR